MSKEELIQYIENLKKERAFSEEDRYLLKILDESPFTIWASDRDCIIRFWAGKCEYLYGYNKEMAVGEDFVKLFVANDEQKAAREDQLKIIDDGEIFHNIANDYGKSGNTLRLLTNCWRMKAPNSEEYWNVEMGLIVDFFDQEKRRLEEIIKESRLYKARITKFIEFQKLVRRQFNERKKNFSNAIREGLKQAISENKCDEYKEKTEPFKHTLNTLEEKINVLIEEYLQRVQESGSSARCEELEDSFKNKFDDLIDKFEDEVMDFEVIVHEFAPDATVFGKDNILKEATTEYSIVIDKANSLLNDVEKEIDAYKIHVSRNDDSPILQSYLELKNNVRDIIESVRAYQDKIFIEVYTVKKDTEVVEIRSAMHSWYDEMRNRLEQLYSVFKRKLSDDEEKAI